MKVVEWTEADARGAADRRYEPPYDFYALADPADAAAVRDPAPAGHYRAVLGEEGERLDAFGCERTITLYGRLGFREADRETRRFELVGEHEFLRMERPA